MLQFSLPLKYAYKSERSIVPMCLQGCPLFCGMDTGEMNKFTWNTRNVHPNIPARYDACACRSGRLIGSLNNDTALHYRSGMVPGHGRTANIDHDMCPFLELRIPVFPEDYRDAHINGYFIEYFETEGTNPCISSSPTVRCSRRIRGHGKRTGHSKSHHPMTHLCRLDYKSDITTNYQRSYAPLLSVRCPLQCSSHLVAGNDESRT